MTTNHKVLPNTEEIPPEWLFDEQTTTWYMPLTCPNNTATCSRVETQPTIFHRQVIRQ